MDKPQRVLVVDDDEALQRVFSRVLSRAGYEVVTAGDGKTALGHVAAGAFDVIVSDIMMPEMNGLELLRAVRRYDLDVPVVLITAAPSLDTATRAVDYGAFRYLTKPVDVDALLKVVGQAQRAHAMARLKREVVEHQVGDRAGLEVRFASAIDKLFMAYQPIVAWPERQIYGYEALVRSHEPTMPHPAALFDAATRLDRLVDFGQTIRVCVAGSAGTLPTQALLFCNVHPWDLLDATLLASDGPIAPFASRTVLEITERNSLENVNDVHLRVATLRQLGYRIAVDDLGAGYAGLSSFALLEPDVAKLDMSIVRDVETSALKQRLIRSMTDLCKEMGVAVIAEGVETVAERDCLVQLGVGLMQGFLFARPAWPVPDVRWE